MLFFVHMPKCGGSSLRKTLAEAYGDRLLLDYTNPLKMSPLRRQAELLNGYLKGRKRAAGYDCVFGHYCFDRYAGYGSADGTRRAAFFREPMDLLCSRYFYLQRKHPEDYQESIETFVARRVNRSFFRIFLGRTRVDRLDFVGLTEDYARSLQLFEAIFGCELTEYRRNVNQARPDDYGTYLQDRGVHQTVSRLMAENQTIYDLTRRRFESLCREYGV